jgi:hypothetical protein
MCTHCEIREVRHRLNRAVRVKCGEVAQGRRFVTGHTSWLFGALRHLCVGIAYSCENTSQEIQEFSTLNMMQNKIN